MFMQQRCTVSSPTRHLILQLAPSHGALALHLPVNQNKDPQKIHWYIIGYTMLCTDKEKIPQWYTNGLRLIFMRFFSLPVQIWGFRSPASSSQASSRPSLHGKDAMGSATASIHARLRHSALLLRSRRSQISRGIDQNLGTWKRYLSMFHLKYETVWHSVIFCRIKWNQVKSGEAHL